MQLQSESSLTRFFRETDWKLLLFLVLFLNVKLLVKAAALLLIYLLRFQLPRIRRGSFPLFYAIAPAIAIINWLLHGYFSEINYNITLAAGICFWIAAFLAFYQIKKSVETHPPSVIHRTLTVFFVLNALVSLTQLALIIWETGSPNPYRYQGDFQKYFISTGDYIRGLSFDTSTTNALLSSFGVVYFLQRHRYALMILCMAVLLLTGSNFTNLLLLAVLAFLFFFRATAGRRSLIVACCLLLFVFWEKISPQNNRYLSETWQKFVPEKETASLQADIISHSPTPEAIRRAYAQHYLDSMRSALITKNNIETVQEKPALPEVDIHSAPYQQNRDTTERQRRLIAFVEDHRESMPLSAGTTPPPQLPGKAYAFMQTLTMLKENPMLIPLGTGLGNFSSRLAVRATALDIDGGYPDKFARYDEGYLGNHLDVMVYYFSKQAGLHSLVNNPNSVYGQLISEYGLIGFISFIIFYLGYFLKRINYTGYSLPVVMLMLGAFAVDYWFEQLSIVLIFELIMMLHLKESKSSFIKRK